MASPVLVCSHLDQGSASLMQGFGQFESRGRTHSVNHIASHKLLTITAGCVQGLLEGCAQCTAGAGALVAGASLRNTRVAALPVSTEAHRVKFPSLCHHQAWRLCQAVCWVSTCQYLGQMLQCHCESALSFVMVVTVVIAGINLLVALRLMWATMQQCPCSDTVACLLCQHSNVHAKDCYEHHLCACACFCQLVSNQLYHHSLS